MKVLLVGVGGVGEAIAVLTKDKPWVEKHARDKFYEVLEKLLA